MTPRRRRLYTVLALVTGVGLASALALLAVRDSVSLFYDPTQVLAGEAPLERTFRIGGMVMEGSRRRVPGSLEEHFVVTDFRNSIAVSYIGVPPDLFREGQGVVARGRMRPDGTFFAEEILAKHDENYMSPEVKASLKKRAAPTGSTP